MSHTGLDFHEHAISPRLKSEATVDHQNYREIYGAAAEIECRAAVDSFISTKILLQIKITLCMHYKYTSYPWVKNQRPIAKRTSQIMKWTAVSGTMCSRKSKYTLPRVWHRSLKFEDKSDIYNAKQKVHYSALDNVPIRNNPRYRPSSQKFGEEPMFISL